MGHDCSSLSNALRWRSVKLRGGLTHCSNFCRRPSSIDSEPKYRRIPTTVERFELKIRRRKNSDLIPTGPTFNALFEPIKAELN